MADRHPGTLSRLAVPVRNLVQRFMFLGLVLAAFGLMLVGKFDALLVDRVRAHVTDAMSPILAAVSKPVATVAAGIEDIRSLSNIRGENRRLRVENAKLLQWQTAARRLMAENRSLQGLLNFAVDPKASFISARVIADSGGAFAQNLVLNAGRADGVHKGQAVVNDAGFVGRVAEVGNKTARVLLISDLNSRIPVIVEFSRVPAILVGANSDRPRLLHTAPGAAISPSDRIVTSGHGGAFPAGLPVGIVAVVTDNRIEVQPLMERSRLEFVRVVDFGLQGILDRPDAAEGEPAPPKAVR